MRVPSCLPAGNHSITGAAVSEKLSLWFVSVLWMKETVIRKNYMNNALFFTLLILLRSFCQQVSNQADNSIFWRLLY